MEDIDFSVDGVYECLDFFKSYQDKVNDAVLHGVQVVASALRDSITKFAKAGHPDNPNVISGRLSNSIAYTAEPISDGVAEGVVGPDGVEYAPFVEYGHANRNGYTRPYPYVRPGQLEILDSGQGQTLFENTVNSDMEGV